MTKLVADSFSCFLRVIKIEDQTAGIFRQLIEHFGRLWLVTAIGPTCAVGQFQGINGDVITFKLREQFVDLNDLFMLQCFMELVGLPNPAAIYLLDVYPFFLEEFHTWHRRMGMDRSPIGSMPCC